MTVSTLKSIASSADPIEPAVAVRLADAAVISTVTPPSVIERPAKSAAIPVVELAMTDPATMSLVAPVAESVTFPAAAETLVALSAPAAVIAMLPAVDVTLVSVTALLFVRSIAVCAVAVMESTLRSTSMAPAVAVRLVDRVVISVPTWLSAIF